MEFKQVTLSLQSKWPDNLVSFLIEVLSFERDHFNIDTANKDKDKDKNEDQYHLKLNSFCLKINKEASKSRSSKNYHLELSLNSPEELANLIKKVDFFNYRHSSLPKKIKFDKISKTKVELLDTDGRKWLIFLPEQ